METRLIKNQSELKDFVYLFLDDLKKNKKKVNILALEGDLGVGKTTLTQQIAQYFEVQDHITSPTFVILKKYKINKKDSIFKNLIHIDAYRLNSGEDLKNLGWEDLIKDFKNLIIIEWPERIFEILPNNVLKIQLEFVDENTRKVFYK
ncbi:MAG: tRNA (adenosine(37)-N6)-threonylcarbamoyltransferase complex ATPase subunit type 1 TsaE [Patescibacteria group bacterium]